MMQFGMKSMLENFKDKFYIYKGAAKGKNLTADDIALAIRGYELAFFANLFTSYVFEMTDRWEVDKKDVNHMILYPESDGDPYLEGEEKEGEEMVQSLPQEKTAVEVCGLPKYAQAIYFQTYYHRCTDMTGQINVKGKGVGFGKD
eukprot:14013710-Ditylum_brightwellii.AAC.1